MPFNNPISGEKADRFVQLLELPAGGRVLDAGCGNGELLLRFAAHHMADGVGFDRDARCIEAAKKEAAVRGLAQRCEFHPVDAAGFAAPAASFDLGICVGSSHAFGEADAAYPETIRGLSRFVRPGGFLLIGEGYWKQPPAAEYLKLLGEPTGIYRDHAGNIALAEKMGLSALHAAVSNDDEWDDFEWRHQRKIQRWARENPDDPNCAEQLKQCVAWRDGYLRWGRSTMGFGLYLFQLPEDLAAAAGSASRAKAGTERTAS
jgi:SAM-dependent methyltransferase